MIVYLENLRTPLEHAGAKAAPHLPHLLALRGSLKIDRPPNHPPNRGDKSSSFFSLSMNCGKTLFRTTFIPYFDRRSPRAASRDSAGLSPPFPFRKASLYSRNIRVKMAPYLRLGADQFEPFKRLPGGWFDGSKTW